MRGKRQSVRDNVMDKERERQKHREKLIGHFILITARPNPLKSHMYLNCIVTSCFICRENRYLLFLTENYAALQVIKHYLHDEVGLRHDKTEEGDRKISEETTSVGHRMEPFVLFGSSFPKDREYTQVCRNINQIKICMETGRTVILLNLENLYESLYDLLNQYYIHLGDQRYVDLGLQTHRVKCRVHNNFK